MVPRPWLARRDERRVGVRFVIAVPTAQTRGPCTPGVTEKYAGNGVFEDVRVLNRWKVCVIYITEMGVFGLKIGNFS